MSTKLYLTIKDGKLDLGSNESVEWLSKNEGKRIVLSVFKKVRTSQQNKSIHTYLTQRATTLDMEGHTMQDVVKSIRRAEIRPTMLALKEIVWKGIQLVMFQKASTKKITTAEVDRIYEVCERFFQKEFPNTGHVPFPAKELSEGAKAIRDW